MNPASGLPRTVDEALLRLQERPDTVALAGCTDWMVRDRLARADAPPVIDLLAIEELHGIEEIATPPSEAKRPAGADADPTTPPPLLRIGATTTFGEIRVDRRVVEGYPILAEVASQIGSRQIQNRATLGGNLVNASPAGDSLPVLLALAAKVEIAGPDGRRRIPYDAFHLGYRETALGPGELLTAVLLPPPPPHQAFRKVGTRAAVAISKVMVAMAAHSRQGRWSSMRIAAGSVAPVPMRLRAAEKVCEGAPIDVETATEAAEAAWGEVEPIDDVRSTARYRRWALSRVVRRLLLEM